jgi:hypothetical protein
MRAIIDQLRQAGFAVNILRWPYLRGETEEPTWQGAATAVARELRSGDHVVGFGCGIWMALLGIQEAGVRPSSLACVTLAVPAATMEVLGLSVSGVVGDQTGATTNSRWLKRRLGVMMQTAAGADVDTYVSLFLQQADASRHDTFLSSHEALDVIAELRPIDCAALFLQLNRAPGEQTRSMDVGVLLPRPEGEDRELLRRFLPNISFGRLSSFPTRLHEVEAAREVWAQVIPFLKQHSTVGDTSSVSA